MIIEGILEFAIAVVLFLIVLMLLSARTIKKKIKSKYGDIDNEKIKQCSNETINEILNS